MHGAEKCDTKSGEPLFSCKLAGVDRQILKQKHCTVTRPFIKSNEAYQYDRSALISLESALDPGATIPLDIAGAKLHCSVRFD